MQKLFPAKIIVKLLIREIRNFFSSKVSEIDVVAVFAKISSGEVGSLNVVCFFHKKAPYESRSAS